MAVKNSIQSLSNTCVLLAPRAVDIGKHVTDAIRAGGWTLLRTDKAIDAMVALCELERAQREEDEAPSTKHMLLIHRDIDERDIVSLTEAVHAHLPGVKVHQVQAKPKPSTEDSAVVGRIGYAVPAPTSAQSAMERAAPPANAREDDIDDDVDAPPPHEVTRDEIAMLLSDETGLPPRQGKGSDAMVPGSGIPGSGIPGAGLPGAGDRH